MTFRSGSMRLATVLAILMLPACPGPPKRAVTSFDKGNMFTAEDPVSAGQERRIFECLQKGPDGECVQRKCTEGPGSFSYDCASYAGDCVEAGYHWSGTKESGVCSIVL